MKTYFKSKTELFAFSKLKGKVIGAYVSGQGAGSMAATLSWSYSNAGAADRS